MRDPALEALLARRGTVKQIAAALGISTAAVSQWKRIPEDRVSEIAKALNLPPASLRPDLAPAPPHSEPSTGAPRMVARPVLRRRRRTKIIATLGPASSSAEMIEKLHRAGADIFRLNFSHGSHEDHAARIATIRAVEAKVGRPIGILADVQGPKLRVGRFQAGRVQLQSGQSFKLDLNPTPGDARRVNLPHPEIIAAAQIGTTLLLDDGKLRLRVTHKRPDHLETQVVVGGPLSDRKGVNVPDVALPIPALTEKDRADLAFVLDQGVEYIGLSFVQRPEDVAEAKEIAAGRAWIMVKLEKPQALENLDAIMALTDCVMVARGDLGVELPPEEVPLAQKRIVRTARALGKPVVVATQMLESMITAPSPTAARQVAETIEAEVIATFSSTGSTTLRVARERPHCPILGLTTSAGVARRMALIWGVHSLEVSEIHSMTEMVARATRAAQHEGFAKSGDEVVVTAGVPFGTPGTTNALRVAIVK